MKSCIPKKDWAKKMVLWVDVHGHVTSAKKVGKCFHCDVTHREPQSENEKMFSKSEQENFPNP